MKQKDAYIEIAQRYIQTAKQHQSLSINTQEVIGFLTYHGLESIAVAVIVHYKSSVPLNHETKLRMFLAFCKKHLSNSVNLKLIAALIIRLEKNGYRSKFLYPELIDENNFKSPQQQITLTEAGLLVKDVERVINQILSSI
ncbi:hypothetical protein PL11201_610050 [Planktothrix sp. PCC 11201]|uniref:hypothetical protein n=1 Tax=Planktothrix sp. PCC 11201 TaxID=1729650 RepID=UPI00091890E6|nr:hypothetical protein [Planktothrix sp. PCC 11201]SKB14204.1 hypothetical protein PL11201_610050 [Planktothrix sp. PCC 11201]